MGNPIQQVVVRRSCAKEPSEQPSVFTVDGRRVVRKAWRFGRDLVAAGARRSTRGDLGNTPVHHARRSPTTRPSDSSVLRAATPEQRSKRAPTAPLIHAGQGGSPARSRPREPLTSATPSRPVRVFVQVSRRVVAAPRFDRPSRSWRLHHMPTISEPFRHDVSDPGD